MVTGLTVMDAVVTYTTTGGATVTAVDHVDLQVAPGEVLALLGASGSGKSSLLRAIAGLEPLVGGTVAWDGKDLARTKIHKRGFGMIFQDAALFPTMDVGHNVAYGLRLLSKQKRAERVAELLELVGLPGYEKRRTTELSGGQAQRVALARSLAPKPRLLLLDEPLSALDRGLREHMADVVRDVLRATGTTAIHVTHDQDEAATVADRVAVLHNGTILQVAEPRTLWRHPDSLAVARFLGYTPFVDAATAATLGLPAVPAGMVVGLGERSLVPDAGGATLPVEGRRPHRDGTEVLLTLPDGQRAGILVPGDVGDELAVRLLPDAVAYVPAASSSSM